LSIKTAWTGEKSDQVGLKCWLFLGDSNDARNGRKIIYDDVLFRGQKHTEKVDSGFQGNSPAFYRESQAKSGIDFLEMNCAK